VPGRPLQACSEWLDQEYQSERVLAPSLTLRTIVFEDSLQPPTHWAFKRERAGRRQVSLAMGASVFDCHTDPVRLAGALRGTHKSEQQAKGWAFLMGLLDVSTLDLTNRHKHYPVRGVNAD
jgi:hypothetical protein